MPKESVFVRNHSWSLAKAPLLLIRVGQAAVQQLVATGHGSV
jgi:hypothetical protein